MSTPPDESFFLWSIFAAFVRAMGADYGSPVVEQRPPIPKTPVCRKSAVNRSVLPIREENI